MSRMVIEQSSGINPYMHMSFQAWGWGGRHAFFPREEKEEKEKNKKRKKEKNKKKKKTSNCAKRLLEGLENQSLFFPSFFLSFFLCLSLFLLISQDRIDCQAQTAGKEYDISIIIIIMIIMIIIIIIIIHENKNHPTNMSIP